MASLNPKSFTPLYQQVADILRSRIIDGTYGPGSKLPSESELIEELGSVTRPTIRNGLAILVQEGLTESRQGKGVFVREVPPVIAVRSSRFSRQARAQGKGALAAEAEALGLEWRSEELSPIEIVTVSPDVAKVIGEEEAVVKRRRMWVGGVPTQLADSYIPASVDREIGYSAGQTAPGGIYGLLEANGHEIVRYRERLRARLAMQGEAIALELPLGAPVVVLVRHAIDQDGKVVEYFDSVAAADRHIYDYEFDAPA